MKVLCIDDTDQIKSPERYHVKCGEFYTVKERKTLKGVDIFLLNEFDFPDYCTDPPYFIVWHHRVYRFMEYNEEEILKLEKETLIKLVTEEKA